MYGAQIHAVVPDASAYREQIQKILSAEHIEVTHLDWIAPTLEDVFISAVKS